MIVSHPKYGCLGSFHRGHHEYALAHEAPAVGQLMYQRVDHKGVKNPWHHWHHFVDKMGAWGVDVRDARPRYCRPVGT